MGTIDFHEISTTRFGQTSAPTSEDEKQERTTTQPRFAQECAQALKPFEISINARAQARNQCSPSACFKQRKFHT